ncbi:hypothetical protein [Rhizobium binxianense]
MTSEDWERFDSWYELFDRLCQLRGYSANAELANDMCRQMGRFGERDFQAIEKNLRDWRLGRRIPLRRNALVLATLLEVDSDPDLRRRWDATHYASGSRREADPDLGPSDGSSTANDDKSYWNGAGGLRLSIVLVAALPLGLLAAMGMNGHEALGPGYVDETKLPTIAYNARAFLPPGAEKLIHGVVEGCDGGPPEWVNVEPNLPASNIGRFVDGGLATQMMNGCGKEMLVRAVKFIAARPGVEELKVLGAYFKIEVAPPSIRPDQGY